MKLTLNEKNKTSQTAQTRSTCGICLLSFGTHVVLLQVQGRSGSSSRSQKVQKHPCAYRFQSRFTHGLRICIHGNEGSSNQLCCCRKRISPFALAICVQNRSSYSQKEFRSRYRHNQRYDAYFAQTKERLRMHLPLRNEYSQRCTTAIHAW